METLERAEAISQLAQYALSNLSQQERASQLESMQSEYWDEDEEWGQIPETLRAELKAGQLQGPASDNRYDAILVLWLRRRYEAADNAYLIACLEGYGLAVDEIIGTPPVRHPCPCCGRCTLEGRGCYDICCVCWWEDDGQDNPNADRVKGGPNYHLSLTQARVNFLLAGISDPMRTDLRQHQDPVEMYEVGRRFRLSDDHIFALEEAGDWISSEFGVMRKEDFDLETNVTRVAWRLDATREPLDPRRDLLREDLIQIEFGNGLVLDVGWYPEFSSDGTFRLVVVDDDWDAPLRRSTSANLADLHVQFTACLEYARTLKSPAIVSGT
jgi:hypothetical protein